MASIRFFLIISGFMLILRMEAISQNLIENGDFETSDPFVPNTWAGGGGVSTVDDAIPWEDDFISGIMHSPDRFRPCSGGVRLRDGSPTAPYVEGNDGCSFVGMFEHEIFEQEVDGEKNDPYQLTFFIRLIEDPYRVDVNNNIGPHPDDPFEYSLNAPVTLNVLMAKNKIGYASSSGITKFMGGGQEIETISNPFSIVKNAYPLNEWHQITATIACSFDFDYIGFELDGPGYVAIDGISLVKLPGGCEACEEALCGPFDGCIDITFGNTHGITNPNTNLFQHWGIGGLNEVRQLRVDLFNTLGQLFRTINVTNPGSTWKYDGRDNLFNELPAATYNFEIKCWNDCGVAEFSGSFLKMNDFGVDTPNPHNYNPYFVPPEPCCENFIFINNLAVPDGEPVTIDEDMEIKAIKGIFIGPGVDINSTVDVTCLVENGGLIQIEAGVNLIGSSKIIQLYVDDCDTFVGESADDRESNQDNGDGKASLAIRPNPNNGSFNIDLPTSFHNNAKVIVRNSGGLIVHESIINTKSATFNLHDLGKGIYFVQIKDEHQVFQQKMLVF